MHKKIIPSVCLSAFLSVLAQGVGAVAISGTAPSSDILSFHARGTIWTKLYDKDADDNPPGMVDLRSTGSQGELQGIWILPADSLLPRNHDNLFIRIKTSE